MKVRLATTGDEEALSEVHTAAWRAAYRGIAPEPALGELGAHDFVEVWMRNVADVDRVDLVAEEQGDIVGFLSFGNAVDNVVELIGLYVHPENWRMGIGRRLLSEALMFWDERRYSSAVLWVLSDNESAQRFYIDSQFQATGAVRTASLLGRALEEHEFRRLLLVNDPGV